MPSLNQLRYALRNALEFTNKPFWDYKSSLRSRELPSYYVLRLPPTLKDFRSIGDVSQINFCLITVNCCRHGPLHLSLLLSRPTNRMRVETNIYQSNQTCSRLRSTNFVFIVCDFNHSNSIHSTIPTLLNK